MGWDFHGGPLVKTLPSNAGSTCSIPGWGAKIPHALRPKNQDIHSRSNTITNSIKIKKKKCVQGKEATPSNKVLIRSVSPPPPHLLHLYTDTHTLTHTVSHTHMPFHCILSPLQVPRPSWPSCTGNSRKAGLLLTQLPLIRTAQHWTSDRVNEHILSLKFLTHFQTTLFVLSLKCKQYQRIYDECESSSQFWLWGLCPSSGASLLAQTGKNLRAV